MQPRHLYEPLCASAVLLAIIAVALPIAWLIPGCSPAAPAASTPPPAAQPSPDADRIEWIVERLDRIQVRIGDLERESGVTNPDGWSKIRIGMYNEQVGEAIGYPNRVFELIDSRAGLNVGRQLASIEQRLADDRAAREGGRAGQVPIPRADNYQSIELWVYKYGSEAAKERVGGVLFQGTNVAFIFPPR